VAVHRVVVEGDLGVEGDDLAVAGDDERVDLEQGAVELVVGGGEALQELDGAAGDGLGEAEGEGQLAGLERLEADGGVDRLAEDLLRLWAATSSMSMPPSVEAMMVVRPVTRSRVMPR
jgi:hypothetical protein